MTAMRQLFGFHGGLELTAHKQRPIAHAIETLSLVGEYVLPLTQHIGTPSVLVVQVGDTVKKGQLLAAADGAIGAALHAPTSGVIRAIEMRPVPHVSGLNDTCIVLEADGRDAETARDPWPDWQQRAPVAIRDRVRDSGIVGLGGAAFPSWIKLNGEQRAIELLILNGAECEPYIACDAALMQEQADAIIGGARIMLHALQAAQCLIAIEDDKPDAAAALEAALQTAADPHLELVRVPVRYPEGGERQLIRMLTSKEVPHNGLPLDLGVVCHNVATAAAVQHAVVAGEPLISRIVTVTGSGVAEARNLHVRIGTPISALVQHCGGYTPSAARLIMGGPMMGFALPHDDIPVVKASNCILVATEEYLRPVEEPMPCIRCGDCAEVCPASLLPQQLFWHASAGEYGKTQDYDLFDCIECGCCDVVCPSHIPLTGWFRYAKSEIREQTAEHAQAKHARQRFEARNERLEREKQQREARRRQQQAALAEQDPKAVIAAARERARQKHEQD